MQFFFFFFFLNNAKLLDLNLLQSSNVVNEEMLFLKSWKALLGINVESHRTQISSIIAYLRVSRQYNSSYASFA